MAVPLPDAGDVAVAVVAEETEGSPSRALAVAHAAPPIGPTFLVTPEVTELLRPEDAATILPIGLSTETVQCARWATLVAARRSSAVRRATRRLLRRTSGASVADTVDVRAVSPCSKRLRSPPHEAAALRRPPIQRRLRGTALATRGAGVHSV